MGRYPHHLRSNNYIIFDMLFLPFVILNKGTGTAESTRLPHSLRGVIIMTSLVSSEYLSRGIRQRLRYPLSRIISCVHNASRARVDCFIPNNISLAWTKHGSYYKGGRLPHVACHTSPATRRLPHIACHTSPATRRLPHVACPTSPATHRLPHVACPTSPATHRLPHIACHTSPATRRLPHVACHTSPATPGQGHVSRGGGWWQQRRLQKPRSVSKTEQDNYGCIMAGQDLADDKPSILIQQPVTEGG